MNSISLSSHSLEETIAIGRRIGELCRGGEEARLMECASLYPTVAPWKKKA